MKPSNFTSYPWSSVFQNSETETIAQNIMVILKRTGDNFRELSWEEYEAERKKDGGFSVRENGYFESAQPYTVSAEKAATFSRIWAESFNESEQ